MNADTAPFLPDEPFNSDLKLYMFTLQKQTYSLQYIWQPNILSYYLYPLLSPAIGSPHLFSKFYLHNLIWVTFHLIGNYRCSSPNKREE